MMYKRMTVLVAGMLAVLTSAHAADLYVSLEGSDDNSGSKGKPFASLAAARDAARSYAGKEAVTVQVADGVYYLPETLIFTTADSGAEKYPVTYQARKPQTNLPVTTRKDCWLRHQRKMADKSAGLNCHHLQFSMAWRLPMVRFSWPWKMAVCFA